MIIFVRSLAATPDTDLVLKDGRTLTAARILTIGDKTVTVVHARGVETIEINLFPLDALARAHMELEAKAAERRQKEEESKRRAKDQIEAADKAKQEEIQIRLAAAAARERAETSTANQKTSPPPTDAQLMALKARFPTKRTETVAFDRNKRQMQNVTTTTRTTTDYVSQSTTAANTRIGGTDTITVEVPHPDIWSDYKGRVQTATPQSLPITLAKLDEKIEADLQRLHGQAHSLNSQVSAAQARMTIEWINQTLRPYLAQLQNLAGR